MASAGVMAMERSRKYLLSIDPGLATGVALLNTEDLINPVQLGTNELDIPSLYAFLEETFKAYGNEMMVVCEAFIVTVETVKNQNGEYWSLELIGLVKFFCWKYQVPMTLQNPDARTFATHPMIKEVGFWHKGGEGHAIQALRHAFVWILNRDRRFLRRVLHLV